MNYSDKWWKSFMLGLEMGGRLTITDKDGSQGKVSDKITVGDKFKRMVGFTKQTVEISKGDGEYYVEQDISIINNNNYISNQGVVGFQMYIKYNPENVRIESIKPLNTDWKTKIVEESHDKERGIIKLKSLRSISQGNIYKETIQLIRIGLTLTKERGIGFKESIEILAQAGTGLYSELFITIPTSTRYNYIQPIASGSITYYTKSEGGGGYNDRGSAIGISDSLGGLGGGGGGGLGGNLNGHLDIKLPPLGGMGGGGSGNGDGDSDEGTDGGEVKPDKNAEVCIVYKDKNGKWGKTCGKVPITNKPTNIVLVPPPDSTDWELTIESVEGEYIYIEEPIEVDYIYDLEGGTSTGGYDTMPDGSLYDKDGNLVDKWGRKITKDGSYIIGEDGEGGKLLSKLGGNSDVVPILTKQKMFGFMESINIEDKAENRLYQPFKEIRDKLIIQDDFEIVKDEIQVTKLQDITDELILEEIYHVEKESGVIEDKKLINMEQLEINDVYNLVKSDITTKTYTENVELKDATDIMKDVKGEKYNGVVNESIGVSDTNVLNKSKLSEKQTKESIMNIEDDIIIRKNPQ